jgi:epsilon-lactone hydrolase
VTGPGKVEIANAIEMPVQATWYRVAASDPKTPVLLYVYGGTFAMNRGPSHEKIASRLAVDIKGQVLVPDYSLAPERPFPLAIEDIVSVYRTLLSEGHRPDQIILMGDTAGAAIAFAALLSLRAQGDPLPVGAIALFPWVDLTMSGGSYVDHIRHDGQVSDLELLATFLGDYLQGVDPRDPLASPVLADLRGLPPCQVHANVNDILADDARLLTQNARAANVSAQLHLWDDVPATLQRDAPFSSQMNALFTSIGEFVRGQVGRQSVAKPNNLDLLKDDYLAMMANNIQPHMEKRIDEMFAWAKDHGPDWVWSFIEKRIEHGALATQEHIEREWLASLFADSGQPTVLLTASRYVVHANKAAYAYLDEGKCLRRVGGRLVGANKEADVILEDVLGASVFGFGKDDAVRPPSLAKMNIPNRGALILRCHKLDPYGEGRIAPPVAVLKFLEPDREQIAIDEECLVAWYGFSPREAALAAHFTRGTNLQDYATQEDVSMATVRTQFAAIKSKLGAVDQAGVVRKILTAVALNH